MARATRAFSPPERTPILRSALGPISPRDPCDDIRKKHYKLLKNQTIYFNHRHIQQSSSWNGASLMPLEIPPSPPIETPVTVQNITRIHFRESLTLISNITHKDSPRLLVGDCCVVLSHPVKHKLQSNSILRQILSQILHTVKDTTNARKIEDNMIK